MLQRVEFQQVIRFLCVLLPLALGACGPNDFSPAAELFPDLRWGIRMTHESAHATREDRRASCGFGTGATVLDTLGIGREERGQIPIDHVIILIQENRSFDHYFGRMPQYGHIEVD